MQILDFIINELKTNNMLTGLIGGSVSVGILYTLKNVPEKILYFAKRLFVSEILLTNDNESYEFRRFLEFIQNNYNPIFRQSSYRAVYLKEKNSDQEKVKPLLGYGRHYFWISGVLCRIHYREGETKVFSQSIREEITVSALTLKGSIFFDKLFGSFSKTYHDQIEIFTSVGRYWDMVISPQCRSLESIILPNNLKKEIVSVVENFLTNKSWFLEKGIARKVSFLFEGPPGTGKTSMAVALATEFKLRLYSLNFGAVKSDVELLCLMQSIPSDSILLIEDIDCIGIPDRKENPGEEGVTLSGILNAIDGVTASQGKILIMTTNDSSTLDPALTRPGRVDHRKAFDILGENESRKLFQLLGCEKNGHSNISPAEIERLAKKSIGL